jgi:ABC-2 type transport system ATP-binding protein
MCDRVAILVGGRLAAVDSPERLKATIQGTQSVRVAFGGNGADIEDALAKIPTVSRVTREGDKWRLYTDEPTVVLDGVFRYAQGNQLELLSVNTMGPSLEDIFLRLVGGKPR